MPWKASSVMEERLRFVARLLDGEAMTEVCREFGISRKTGYKIFDRYKEHGLEALNDRSQAAGPLRQSAAGPDREPDRPPEGREAALGSAQDPRAAGQAARRRYQGSCQEHHPCGARPPRPGQARRRAAPPRARHAALGRRCSQ